MLSLNFNIAIYCPLAFVALLSVLFHFLLGLAAFRPGLTPIIRQSGSSVNGRTRIREIGNQKLRNLLFICSFNGCKYNKAFRDLYERIVAKGKRKKLALIAVCNKLLKQAFAIAKSGLIFDIASKNTLVKN